MFNEDWFKVHTNFSDFDQLLKRDELVEEPISIERFLRDPHYLGMEYDLSPMQLEFAKHMTQIFKPHTLVQLYGEAEGLAHYDKYTVNEVVGMIGKGGGKDYTSRISFLYVIYLLHCLRDPITYYEKGYGVTLDLINLAVNAKQAQNVFFEPLKKILLRSPFFTQVGFEPRRDQIEFFSRPIRCFSGHSEGESWEGFEPLLIVLDELAAFKTPAETKGDERARGSAKAIYEMSRFSVLSRFPDVGKVVLISFPRFSGDPITTRYQEVMKGVEKKVWAIKAATWEFNPTRKEDDFANEFVRDPIGARARLACEPPEMEDSYFRDLNIVRENFHYGVDPYNHDDGTFAEWFNGSDGIPRFIQIDLGLKRDKMAICMVHCKGFKEVKTFAGIEVLPIIEMDFIHAWKAANGEENDFSAVRDMVRLLGRKFNVAMITMDNWQSAETVKILRNWGFNADYHTVKKADYDTLQTAFYDKRIRGYWNEQLVENELLKLVLINNTKVDHPNKYEKDMADCLAGAVFKCVQNLDSSQEIDVEVWRSDDEFSDIKIPSEIMNVKGKEHVRQIPSELEAWLFESL